MKSMFDPENADVVKKFVFRYLNVILQKQALYIFIQRHTHNSINKSSS